MRQPLPRRAENLVNQPALGSHRDRAMPLHTEGTTGCALPFPCSSFNFKAWAFLPSPSHIPHPTASCVVINCSLHHFPSPAEAEIESAAEPSVSSGWRREQAQAPRSWGEKGALGDPNLAQELFPKAFQPVNRIKTRLLLLTCPRRVPVLSFILFPLALQLLILYSFPLYNVPWLPYPPVPTDP